jgi:hypothetical protein
MKESSLLTRTPHILLQGSSLGIDDAMFDEESLTALQDEWKCRRVVDLFLHLYINTDYSRNQITRLSDTGQLRAESVESWLESRSNVGMKLVHNHKPS